MQLHNPHSHSELCHAIGETLEPFETREVTDEQAKRVSACEGCRCRVTQIDAPEKPKARSTGAKAQAAAE